MNRQTQSGHDLRRGWLSLIFSILFVSSASAIVGTTAFGQAVERQFGLDLAFWLRGERAPPDDVVFVPVNEASAIHLGGALKDNDLSWARKHFTRLLEKLTHAGASVIAFDVKFIGRIDDSDEALARAMADAGNVVLLNWVRQRIDHDEYNRIIGDKRELKEPAAIFVDSARALGLWELPRDHRFDRFHTFPRVASRNIPALPVVALYLHLRTDFEQALQTCEPLRRAAATSAHPTEQLEQMRSIIRRDQQTERRLPVDAECSAALRHPVGQALADSGERIFNFYAKSGSFAGPALHEIVGRSQPADLDRLSGKVVFIGLDDRGDVDAEDHFPSVQGDDYISGVELAATAFANLRYGHDIRAVGFWPGVGLLLLVATVAGAAFLLPLRWAGLALVASALLYLVLFRYRFEHDNVLLPIVVPLVAWLCMALFGSLWRIGELQRVTRFAMVFVPYSYRRRIELRRRIDFESEPLFAVCMHTDIAGYTGICAKLHADPDRLESLEKEYWALLTKQVRRERGERLEISGDSMLCVWALPSREKTVARACSAALRILRAVDAFNQRHPEIPFNTRIGMDAGTVKLKLVGGDQLQLSAGGDVANTSERLENDINKLLGTRALVSGTLADHAGPVAMRRVGTFTARGKHTDMEVYQLLESSDAYPYLHQFAQALAAFEAGEWNKAMRAFQALQRLAPDDGPTGFYLARVAAYVAGKAEPPVGGRPGLIVSDDPGGRSVPPPSTG